MHWRCPAQLLIMSLLCAACRGAEPPLFHEDFQTGLSSRWQKVVFSGETFHSLRQEGTNSFLEARATNSASGLAVKIDSVKTAGTVLRWRWKIDHTPPGGSESDIKTFDHTARLFVAFKTLIGPPRSINYVWANETPVGQTFHHPSSHRSRFIVLETGNGQAGQWAQEERDLAADWQRLFGDEAPAIVGLGLMTDSDGTKSTVTGAYDDIELIRRDPPRK